MSETEVGLKTRRFPFLLKAVAIFLAADGLFKLIFLFFGIVPGPRIFGLRDSFYFYCLVAVVDISLAVQIVGRAHYAWIWSFTFFVLRAVVLLTFFTFTNPVSWLAPGVLGRVQIIASIAIFIILARIIASRQIREILSPHPQKTA